MSKLKTILVNICRLLVSLTLIFSGFVKAIDPLGTQYKIQDYLAALSMGSIIPDWLTLSTSVLLAALEFSLGLFLLFAIHRRVVSRLILLLMIVMTVITLWVWIANPVKDCGCFGDAIVLTNGQTFLKNIILLAAAVIICMWPLRMVRFISKTNQWIVVYYTVLFIIITSIYCLYNLPLFDFRPYKEGSDLRKAAMGVEPLLETTFILEKDGERREFTLDNYPDSTWTFIDNKTKTVKPGIEPILHDFFIEEIDSIADISTGKKTVEYNDITEDILYNEGYTFLLISPYLEHADDSNFGDIDQIYEYCQDNDYDFYCLTASGGKGIQRWRELTGAEYPFCRCDGTTLKTIIRSNPGLLLLHDGKVVRKWSHNFLPDATNMKDKLENLEIGQSPSNSVPRKVVRILLWFVLPLFVLTFADRLWAWTKWVRRKKKDTEERQDKKEEEKTT
ncbi:MAG: DoxX family protein [Prevotella sp.]|nr:DoxX family protein [Prevotella sp.]